MWTFRRRKSFRKSYDGLTRDQKEAVREAWPRFREDPFNPQFRTHQIQRLQKFYGKTVYSVVCWLICGRCSFWTGRRSFSWTSARTRFTADELRPGLTDSDYDTAGFYTRFGFAFADGPGQRVPGQPFREMYFDLKPILADLAK